MTPAIKFSHKYWKMPLHHNPSRLLEVITTDSLQFHKGFVEYDTKIVGGGNYPLPKGKVLLLLLITMKGELWTTIRRYTEQKEKYYRGLRGVVVEIVVGNSESSQSW